MRLAAFDAGGVPRSAIVLGDATLLDIGRAAPDLPADPLALIARLDEVRPRLDALAAAPPPEARLARERVRWLPPVPRPGKIACIGLNYRDHAREVGLELPEHLAVFSKWPNVLVADGDPIVVPRASHRVDYEAELCVVIGRRARGVSEADALAYVAGYTCFNDVSVRDYQSRTSQWTMGKVFDTHGPCGPYLVTADEISDPQWLAIRCSIDGEPMQDSSTAEMVFGVARIIAELSAVATLEPGDLIATGTPAGVGTARTPRRWLQPGERVRVEIEGIGALENPVVAEV